MRREKMLSETMLMETHVPENSDDLYHQHWCWVCNADWKHHDRKCAPRAGSYTLGEVDWPCPEHEQVRPEDVE